MILDGSCTFVARRERPETWHGTQERAWGLSQAARLDADLWHCPHEALPEHPDGHCVFHASAEELAGLGQSVDESDHLERAIAAAEREGRDSVGFVGAALDCFEADLDLADVGLNLSHAVVDGPVRLRGTVDRLLAVGLTVGGEFDSETLSVGGPAICERLTVDGDATMESMTVGEHAEFERATFRGELEASRIAVGGYARFWNATFGGYARFWNATFADNLSLGATTFADANFRDGTFGGTLTVEEATFADDVTFARADVDGVARFSTVSFESDARFTDATFASHVTLRDAVVDGNAWFDGVTCAAGADLSGVVVRGDPDLRFASLTGEIDATDAALAGATLVDTSLSGATLSGADLTGADASGATLRAADLKRTTLTRATLFGADLSGARMAGTTFGEAQVDDATSFWSDDAGDPMRERVVYDPECGAVPTTAGDRLRATVTRYLPWGGRDGGRDSAAAEASPAKAAAVYRSVESVARSNSLPRLQTTAFIRRQEMHRRRYASEGEWPAWLRASVARLSLLYGESPWRIISVSVIVVFLCAGLYPFGGFRPSGADDPIAVSTPEGWLAALPDSLYFSTLTFTTLGFGDFQPAGWGRTLVTLETAFGATLLALLVFVLGRRAAR